MYRIYTQKDLKYQNFLALLQILQLRFRKLGTVWCGGARETRDPRVTIG